MFSFDYATVFHAPFPQTREYWPVGIVVIGTAQPAFEFAVAVRMPEGLGRLLPALPSTEYTARVAGYREGLLRCQRAVRRSDLALTDVWPALGLIDAEAFQLSLPARVLARDPEDLCFDLYQRYVLTADRWQVLG